MDLMNEELHRVPLYQEGMSCVIGDSAYDFVAQMLTTTGNIALDKSALIKFRLITQ